MTFFWILIVIYCLPGEGCAFSPKFFKCPRPAAETLEPQTLNPTVDDTNPAFPRIRSICPNSHSLGSCITHNKDIPEFPQFRVLKV